MFNNCSSAKSSNFESLANPTDSAVPNIGGDQNLGAYLSLFGKNFGSDLNSIHVYINNIEVAQKILLTTSKGRNDVQQISVRVGSLTGSHVVKDYQLV